MRPRLVALIIGVSLVTGACGGSDAATGLTEVEPSSRPTDLTCPSGGVATAGGLLSELPDGYDSREEALAEWLNGFPEWGTRYILDEDGSGAWILREDETALAHVTFIENKGYTAHGYEACDPLD